MTADLSTSDPAAEREPDWRPVGGTVRVALGLSGAEVDAVSLAVVHTTGRLATASADAGLGPVAHGLIGQLAAVELGLERRGSGPASALLWLQRAAALARPELAELVPEGAISAARNLAHEQLERAFSGSEGLLQLGAALAAAEDRSELRSLAASVRGAAGLIGTDVVDRAVAAYRHAATEVVLDATLLLRDAGTLVREGDHESAEAAGALAAVLMRRGVDATDQWVIAAGLWQPLDPIASNICLAFGDGRRSVSDPRALQPTFDALLEAVRRS